MALTNAKENILPQATLVLTVRLRDRNPLWGIRDLEAVVEAAASANLKLQQVINMPANNLSVIFSRPTVGL